MASPEIPCAASTLLADLIDGAERDLVEVARTRVSVHYRTGDPDLPVLTVSTAEAVRLPASLLTAQLPPPGPGRLGGGCLRAGPGRWMVRRWWRPARPTGLPRPSREHLARVGPVPAHTGNEPPADAELSPATLIGRGPGLTPAGDDVVAGALVAAYATGDARGASWRRATVAALRAGRTTDVSVALLRHAFDGYAVPQLGDLLTDLCTGRDTTRSRAALLAVGHTSGGALLSGVVHALRTGEPPASGGAA